MTDDDIKKIVDEVIRRQDGDVAAITKENDKFFHTVFAIGFGIVFLIIGLLYFGIIK